MLVDDRRLRLAKADEVDQIREDLDEALVRRLVQVCEGKVADTTLVAISTVRIELCAV